jgi:hypothetical protein
MILINQIFYVIFLLFIWFNTDAFISYSKLFRLSKLFKIDKWEQYRMINPKMDYISYIRNKHTNFFTKLITCKTCLTFWFVLISCYFFINLFYFPMIYIISYSIYTLLCKLLKF